jgi:hypothetical protein
VSATDQVGNTKTTTGSFQAVAPLSCNRTDALDAALGSSLPTDMYRKLHHFSFRSADYSTAALICGNLKPDGRPGMVALYDCCTADSPTALGVFEAFNGRWHLLNDLVTRVVYGLKLRNHTLYENTPVYSRSDALCCASHYRTYTPSMEWAPVCH